MKERKKIKREYSEEKIDIYVAKSRFSQSQRRRVILIPVKRKNPIIKYDEILLRRRLCYCKEKKFLYSNYNIIISS
jgi:hypothetical protein